MRLFIAIDIPLPLKETIVRAIEPFKYCGLDATWVAQENIHMTVKFLGETREELLSGIKTTLKQVSAGHAALHAQLTEFGFFPDTRRPRIFYIGTDNELALRNIAYEIEENLEVLGFKQENRFRAHLTLARFKSDHNLPRFHEKLKSVKVTGTIPVTALGLVKSTLSRTGPTYETLWETPLKNY